MRKFFVGHLFRLLFTRQLSCLAICSIDISATIMVAVILGTETRIRICTSFLAPAAFDILFPGLVTAVPVGGGKHRVVVVRLWNCGHNGRLVRQRC